MTKNVFVQVRMTEELNQLVVEQATKKSAARIRETSRSDIIREAIRFYLDHQEDQVGSRRHFKREFQEAIKELRWLMVLLIILVAEIGSKILYAIYDIGDIRKEQLENPQERTTIIKKARSDYRGVALVRTAMESTRDEGAILFNRLYDVSLDAERQRLEKAP